MLCFFFRSGKRMRKNCVGGVKKCVFLFVFFIFFFFKHKTAYDITVLLEFRRVLFRSYFYLYFFFIFILFLLFCFAFVIFFFFWADDRKSVVMGKSVDLGGRRIIKKKKNLCIIAVGRASFKKRV